MNAFARFVARASIMFAALFVLGAEVAGAQSVPGDNRHDAGEVQPAQGGSIQERQGGAVGNGRRAPNPKRIAKPKRRLVRNGRVCSRKKGRRTCTFYRHGKAVRVCTKKRHGPRRCKKPRHAGVRKPPRARAAAIPTNGRLIDEGFINPIPAVGKLWVYSPATQKISGLCTGTLNRRGFVLTAGHCLYNPDEPGQPLGKTTDFGVIIFTPGSTFASDGGSDANSSSTPYGAWAAVNTWEPGCWEQGADGRCDVGLIQLATPGSGTNAEYPGDVTGTYPAYYNASIGVGAELQHIGYAASGVFSTAQLGYGTAPWYCDTAWGGDFMQGDPAQPGYSPLVKTGYYVTVPCNSSGGASGGPWFATIDGSLYQVGVENIGLSPQGQPFDDLEAFQYFEDYFIAFYQSVVGGSAFHRRSATREAVGPPLHQYRGLAAYPTGLQRILERWGLNPDGTVKR